jgi:hypothetical protein
MHNNNPAEELNYFGNPSAAQKGRFYGYPYCWSEYQLTEGLGAGAQWAQPDFMNKMTTTITNEVIKYVNINSIIRSYLRSTFLLYPTQCVGYRFIDLNAISIVNF